jgi:hypothetical protein
VDACAEVREQATKEIADAEKKSAVKKKTDKAAKTKKK